MPNTINIPDKKTSTGDLHTDAAIEALHRIIDLPGLDSKKYLQAHHFLNEFVAFSEEYTKLYGVKVEVGMQDACDLLAVCDDHKAGYNKNIGRRFL